ncbi:50S ribosomal protein L11 methyltransferase [Helicobacter mustelae]|uniref:Ribosomal protein L11 methyltransferase n=1 Tax=Helicobacter mustelae (strain ATCC 43772 / CCUG 25715 / CIP 103759 / LMG 18044 / NCTC 12198 / R85-136P) TaxID=679897 RepID=D3UG59_HELM1|nr:50S ribosomal protein L11 methyltransferase [Helicobacter mustelae]CBG39480.1 Putative ribosomal protein methyltransferase [Helicobacter mustelae 12198]SQH70993.1 ribosomal protein methyltransferase [Helicobacter mustelae]STP12121.1 ribosomal protein methyltransferase [Helicobacter mustelae]
MTEDFFEVTILPQSHCDLFIDFIIDSTGEAIEESLISLDFVKDFEFFALKMEQLSVPMLPTIIVRSQEDCRDLIKSLRSFVQLLGERVGEAVGFAYKIQKKKNEDWIQKYKEGVAPIVCGGFYIRPSWVAPKKDLENLIIDPALAFGSGHHATTAMCIEFLNSLDLREKKCLDVGCGSGILSLVAKKRGANVFLCDTDALAVIESKKNFALNGEQIDQIWEGSIKDEERVYDVIVANILADVIKILYNDFSKALKSGATLILSGILEQYKDSVIDKFSAFVLQEILTKEEWVALKMIKK